MLRVCSLRRENMDDEKNRMGGRDTMGSLHPRSLWRRYRWQIITTVFAVLLLVFAYTTCSPPLPKTEDVVCQSSSTDNWSGWSMGNGWKRLGGMLLNDGSNGH